MYHIPFRSSRSVHDERDGGANASRVRKLLVALLSLATVALLGLLSGRSGYAATPGFIYVSQFRCACVTVYSKSGTRQKVLMTITSGLSDPQGMAVDSSGNLYVADAEANHEGAVLIYPPGAKVPSKSFFETGADPQDVCIGPDGTRYVVNLWTNNGFGPGNVAVYPPGRSHPTRHLSNAAVEYAIATSCSVDTANNVYVGYEGGKGAAPFIDEFAAGGSTPKTLGIFILGDPPLKVANDFRGNLLISDSVYQPGDGAVLLFKPGSVFPFRTLNDPTNESVFALGIAFASNAGLLYVATGPVVNVYEYPSGTIVNKITAGLDRGTHAGWYVAVSPP